MPSTPTHTSTEAPLKEITVVVFSKDRAFQLHECIRSLRQHARVVETCALRVRICVVWTASSPSCENAFRKVLRRLLAPALSKVHRPRDRTRVDARGGPGACRAATGTDTGTGTGTGTGAKDDAGGGDASDRGQKVDGASAATAVPAGTDGSGVVDLLLIDFEKMQSTCMKREVADVMQRFDVFESLGPTLVQQIVHGAVMRSYRPGQLIVGEGEPVTHVHLLRSGVACLQWPVDAKDLGDRHGWLAKSSGAQAAAVAGRRQQRLPQQAADEPPLTQQQLQRRQHQLQQQQQQQASASLRPALNVLQLCPGESVGFLETLHDRAAVYRVVAQERVEALLLPKQLLKMFPKARRGVMETRAFAAMETWGTRLRELFDFATTNSSIGSRNGSRSKGSTSGSTSSTGTGTSTGKGSGESHTGRAGRRHRERHQATAHQHHKSQSLRDTGAQLAERRRQLEEQAQKKRGERAVASYERSMRELRQLTESSRNKYAEHVREQQLIGKTEQERRKEERTREDRERRLRGAASSSDGGDSGGESGGEGGSESLHNPWKVVQAASKFLTQTSRDAVDVAEKVVQTWMRGHHGGGEAAQELHRKVGTLHARDKLRQMLQKMRRTKAIDDRLSHALGKKASTTRIGASTPRGDGKVNCSVWCAWCVWAVCTHSLTRSLARSLCLFVCLFVGFVLQRMQTPRLLATLHSFRLAKAASSGASATASATYLTEVPLESSGSADAEVKVKPIMLKAAHSFRRRKKMSSGKLVAGSQSSLDTGTGSLPSARSAGAAEVKPKGSKRMMIDNRAAAREEQGQRTRGSAGQAVLPSLRPAARNHHRRPTQQRWLAQS